MVVRVRLLRLLLALALSALLVAGTVAAVSPYAREVALASRSETADIDLSALDDFAVRSYVYASDGSLLSTLHGPENREPLTLDQVPDTVKQSVLAVEDSDFYFHGGVNLRATARALLENVSAGSIEQGGSTITQQLVKNALLNSDQDLDRKSKEAMLALRLEEELTDEAEAAGAADPKRVAKDRILETYLNTVYFGSGAYGVQAAAEVYWGKSAADLDWAEAAMLAALISNPVGHDPTLNPDAARSARRAALDRLVDVEVLTSEQAQAFASAPLPESRCQVADATSVACGDLTLPPKEDYFAEEVKQLLLNDPSFGLGAEYLDRYNLVFGGGLRIFTTIDPAAQQAAVQAVNDNTPANSIGVTASMVAVEPSTGAVRAMVGGPGFDQFEYNIATHQPGRQTGSSFKTYVLLTALEMGNVPSDSIEGGGSFANPGGVPDPYRISGKGGTLTSVTTASSNGAFVRLGQVVGLDNVIDLAQRLGISSELAPVISLPLGTVETTPIEMASAYSTIANGGIHQPYYFIDRIEDRDGTVLWQRVPNGTRGFSQQTACLATEILEANVKSGTGTRARLSNQDAAGKTGTTEEHSDAWFVGYTPYLSTAVWMGNPNERVPMYSLGGKANFGGTYPAEIWHDFNETYHAGKPPIPFPACETTRSARKVRGPDDPSKAPGSSSSTGSSSSGSGSKRSPTSPSTTATTAPADPGDDEPDVVEPAPTTAAPPTAPPTITLPPPTTSPGRGGGD